MKKYIILFIFINLVLLLTFIPKVYFSNSKPTKSPSNTNNTIIVPKNYTDINLFGNDPIVYDNMIPVYYDDVDSVWKKASLEEKWYDYENNWWANVVIAKDEYRDKYSNMDSGSFIDLEEILGFFVWIPRFEYKLFNVNNELIDPEEIEVNIVPVTSKKIDVVNGEYFTHPAFTAVYQNGDEYELSGFWIAKFEPSFDSEKNILLLPNKKPIVNINMADMWKYATSISSQYGMNVNSRIITNMEWGAIAYFSYSKYGKVGNEAFDIKDRRIYINNSQGNDKWNNLVTGCSSGHINYGGASKCAYTYDIDKKGTGASSTGNIYGIYDLVGGAWECVMGLISDENIKDNIGAFKGVPPKETRYYTLYESGSMTNTKRGKIGDATRETKESMEEHASWFGNNSYFATKEFPWIKRGGSFRGGGYSGLFDYGITNAKARGDKTFRTILSEY